MSFVVQGHSFGSGQSLYCLDYRISVGTVLTNYGDSAFAIGVENQFRVWIERSRVHVIADRKSRDYFTGIDIQHCHYFAATANEQAVIDSIESHAAGRAAGSSRPAFLNGEFASIDFQNQV